MKNRLKVLRAERDWSQADLAARLKVSRQTVNAIETGKYDPSLPLAFEIAAVFSQPIEQVFLYEASTLSEPSTRPPRSRDGAKSSCT
ncbi:MAG TPA: helix-turn-helix transcriptional regulator [Bryobacteraceae bacterium]|nr:helix-turn-helix transcriptional regulator [Bryobacteraceae bacterium]